MMRKFWVALVLAALSVAPALAQQTWFEFDVSKKLGKKWEFTLAPELRLDESFKVDEYFIEPEVGFKFNKYFSVAAAYRVGNNISRKGNDQWFGRYSFDAKTGYEWKRIDTQFRLRYTNSDDFADEEKSQNLRMKLSFDYNIKGIPLTPFAAYELYRDLQAGEFNKARWEAGLQYKINKHHRVGAYYRLNEFLKTDDPNVNIIGLSYKIKL